MPIPRKKNIAGYYDELGRFRPIRKPSFVGSPKRRATPKDRKKYSRAKAGDLGVVAQEKATGEDFFAKLARKEREAKEKTWSRIEKETLGDADEMDRGRSLVQFVRDKGGIKPSYKFGGKANRGKRISYDAGELAPLTYKQSGKRGLVSEKGKLSLDSMYQAAREAGYDVRDMDDLINRMDDEIKGGSVTYSTRGYIDYRDNPAAKQNGVLIGDSGRRSDLHVQQLGSRSFGVFLKTYLLKKFSTRVMAEKHLASIRAKAKKNPAGKILAVVNAGPGKAWKLLRELDARNAGALVVVSPEGYEVARPKTLAAGKKMLEGVRLKKNPVNIFGFAAAVSGLQSALQIDEMLKKRKPSRRKPRATRKNPGTTTAKRTNPHGDAMPSGARFNEKLFDQDLAAIEDGNFRLIRSAVAHGKLADYKKPEIDRLVQRARLAFQLKEMYRLKANPADVSKLLAPIKSNGAFKRMLERRKAAKALKRELRLEAALEKTREKKRKAIARATNPIKIKLHKFYKGQKLATRFIGDHDLILRGVVQSRTPKFVTVKVEGRPKPVRCGVSVYEGSEMIYPLGRYSMAPTFRAEKGDRVGNPKGKLSKAVARSAKANPPRMCTNRRCGQFEKNTRWAKCPGCGSRTIKKSPAMRRKKPNPSASAKKPPRSRTFEMFQGRPVTSATRRPVSRHAPAKLVQLGDLVEIKLVGMTPIKLNPATVKLTTANGRLWIVGRKFAKPSAEARANEINPIGEIDHVVYGTRKPHHDDESYTHYIHKLGEESGKRPLLCVDKEGFAVIRGGNYKIEARGIVD